MLGIISKKCLGRELRAVILIIFWAALLFAEDFISEFEYGQMLYKDPRGVSCASCHGELGEGVFIASFKDEKNKPHEFYGADIRGLGLKKFKKALEKGGSIMPRYYLTDKEIEAIYKYVVQVNKQSRQDKNNTALDSNESVYADDDINTSDDNISDDNISYDDNDTFDDLEDENTTEDNNNGSIMSKIFKTSEEEQ